MRVLCSNSVITVTEYEFLATLSSEHALSITLQLPNLV